MRADADLAELYGRAAQATEAGSKSFYFATRFFPADMARGAHAVYWFCRTTDDLVDECATREEGQRGLEAWSRAFEQAVTQGWTEDPVLRLFVAAMEKYQIPVEYPRELIEGMRMDLDGRRYETFDELKVFCYRVASVVGLMMCHVIGMERQDWWPKAKQHAIDLGIAMQLTNILRDIDEDYARGRIYLPRIEREGFGYTEEMLANREVNEEFRRLMQFQVERAGAYYKSAEPGIAMIHRRGRFAVQIASDVYSEILATIKFHNFDVFGKRIYVPKVMKYLITGRRMLGRLAS